MTTAPTGQPRRSLTLVADALTAADCAPRLRGDHIDARCPAHDDRSPSLSVDWRDGATLVHCHTGCTAEDVLAALDLHPRDLYDAPWEPGERHGDHTPRPRTPRPPRAPQKPRGPRCVDGHDDHRWASLHREPRDDATQQWWPYVDEQGTVVALKVKLRCTRESCTGKTFRWRYPAPDGRLTYSRPAGLAVPLYRLPEIREAIGRGEPIHWCEGEKDADAVWAAGAAATTHGSKDTGTGGHVKDHHIRAIADAPEVIVWADRDADGGGLTSARSIARRLTAAGARHVRVVEALDGKDAHDHLVARGHALDDARDVTNVTPGPGYPPAGTGTADDDQGAPEMPPGINPDEWRRTGDYGTDGKSTWQLVADREGKRWTCLLDACVTVTTERAAAVDPDFPDRAEDGADTDLEASGDVEITTERGGRRRTKTYRSVPTSRLRALAPLDQYGPSAWLGADTTTTGRSRILRAVLELSSAAGITPVDFYSVTGWHPDGAGGELFIHGAGGIGPAGALPDVETRLGDHLSAFALGEVPTGAELVEALALTLDLVEVGALPGRVLVPVAGIGARPLFGQYRTPGSGDDAATASGWMSGGYGSGKSGAAAASLNPVYPGLTWNGFPLKAGSAKHGGASGPFLERILFRARDLCLPFDDCDPSEPEASRAAWHSDFLRRAAGQYGRGLATIGKEVRASMPCRAGVLGTGEPLDAEASAASRTVNINIGPGDVRISELRRQTGPEDRAARGRLGAGIVAALATDRPRYRALLAQARVALRALFVAGEAPGPVERAAAVFAEIAATWRVVLVIAVEAGMTRADARHHWSVIVDGLREAWRDHLRSIGTGDRSSRALAYVREALASGAVRLDDKDHGAGKPSVDMHGWEHRVRDGYGGQPTETTTEPMSRVMIGYQDAATRDVYLLPGKTTEAVRAAAERAGDHWTGNTAALGSALKASGDLRIPERTARDQEATARPRINGKATRVWHVPAERFDAETDDPGDYAGADYSGTVDTDAAPLPWLETPGAPGSAPGSADHVTCDAPGSAPGAKRGLTCDAPGAPGKSAPQPHGDTAPGACVECGRETEQWRAAEGLMCMACLDWARAHGARRRVCRAPLAPARAASGLCRDHEPPAGPGPDPEDPPPGPVQPTLPEPQEAATGTEPADRADDPTPAAPGPQSATQGRQDRRAERTRKRTAERGAFDRRARAAVAEGRLPRVLAGLEGPFAPTLRGRRPYAMPPLPGMTDAAWTVTGYAWQRDYAGPVVALDRTGAWISGASSTTVAHGALTHTGADITDVSRPGYYLLDAYRWPEADRMPSPLGSLTPPGRVWVPHPTAQLLAQLSREGRWPDVTPLDSYTGDAARLTAWVEWVSQLRADVIDEYGRDSEEYISVKRAYGMAMSMMLGTKDESMRTEWRCKLRRPDWTHAIQSQASATLWRAADRARRAVPDAAPVALRNVDELIIPAGALDALTAPRDPRPIVTIDETGRTLGTYKVKATEEWKGGESK